MPRRPVRVRLSLLYGAEDEDCVSGACACIFDTDIDPWRGTVSGPFTITTDNNLVERGDATRNAKGYDFDLITHTAPNGPSNDVESGWVKKSKHGDGGSKLGKTEAPSKLREQH